MRQLRDTHRKWLYANSLSENRFNFNLPDPIFYLSICKYYKYLYQGHLLIFKIGSIHKGKLWLCGTAFDGIGTIY